MLAQQQAFPPSELLLTQILRCFSILGLILRKTQVSFHPFVGCELLVLSHPSRVGLLGNSKHKSGFMARLLLQSLDPIGQIRYALRNMLQTTDADLAHSIIRDSKVSVTFLTLPLTEFFPGAACSSRDPKRLSAFPSPTLEQ